ncbi:MAG: hypothetical protein AAFP70_05965 [Calditrichota bacterium]
MKSFNLNPKSWMLVLVLFAIIASGCQPIATYRYVLKNDTPYTLEATYTTFDFKDSTVTLLPETNHVIYQYERLGKVKDNKERFELEMQAVRITHKDDVVYVQEPVQRRFWEIDEDKKTLGGGLAEYVLLLNAALLGL